LRHGWAIPFPPEGAVLVPDCFGQITAEELHIIHNGPPATKLANVDHMAGIYIEIERSQIDESLKIK